MIAIRRRGVGSRGLRIARALSLLPDLALWQLPLRRALFSGGDQQ